MTEYFNYNDKFYADQEVSSLKSAEVLVPMFFEAFHPTSVLDIGCGIGAWLKVWREKCNVEDHFGVDAPFVAIERLLIEKSKVLLVDLGKPLNLNRKFDLVVSLEVAEHLKESFADQFVENITKHGDCVIFSAAIPGQEGTFHFNEQWPEYWAGKFKIRGYLPIDLFRPTIWNNEQINYWYRQNILVFIAEDKLPDYPHLVDKSMQTNEQLLTRIHPELLKYKIGLIDKLNSPLGYWKLRWYFIKQKLKM